MHLEMELLELLRLHQLCLNWEPPLRLILMLWSGA